MIKTVVTCDQCGEQLFYFIALSNAHTIHFARKDGWSMGKKHLCPRCRKRKASAVSIQQEEPKIKENDYNCGNCEVIDWCGKVEFSDLAICKNSIVNKLTATEYIEIAKEVDTSELEKSMNENDFEDEDEYDDHLMQLICTEVEKKVCMPTADKEEREND